MKKSLKHLKSITLTTILSGNDDVSPNNAYSGRLRLAALGSDSTKGESLACRADNNIFSLVVEGIPEAGLWIPAGQDDARKISLLVANPANASVCYSIAALGDHQLSLLQVNDASEQIQSMKVGKDAVEISGYTVQLLIIAK